MKIVYKIVVFFQEKNRVPGTGELCTDLKPLEVEFNSRESAYEYIEKEISRMKPPPPPYEQYFKIDEFIKL